MNNGMSRRSLFGTLTAAALAPFVAKARAAFAPVRGRAKPRSGAHHDTLCSITTYICDSNGRLLEIIEPFEAEVTSFTYDAAR